MIAWNTDMRRKSAIIGGIKFTLFIALFLFYSIPAIIVEDIRDSRYLYIAEARSGYEFGTYIRHSVQKTPVYEYYRVEKDGTVTVTRTMLQDLGWGMPSELTGKVVFKNGFMIMDGIDRNMKNLPFRVSYIAEPHIIIKGKFYDLRRYVEDSDLIKIYIKNISHIELMLRRRNNVF